MSEEIAEGIGEVEPHPLETQQPQDTQAEPQQEGDADGEQQAQEKKEAKNYTQDEVDRIVKKAKRNAAYLARKEAESELYQQQLERRERPQEAPQAQQDAPPKREDYDDYEAFLKAEARFEARQEMQQFTRAQQERAQNERRVQSESQQVARYQSDLNKARETIADFDDVLDAAGDVPVTQTMRAAILESDVGALLTYHLAKTPAEAERISKLSPARQAMAIGAIEAEITRKAAPQVSKAPAPIKPISGSSGGHADPSKMSMDEYSAWRAKNGAAWARR